MSARWVFLIVVVATLAVGFAVRELDRPGLVYTLCGGVFASAFLLERSSKCGTMCRAITTGVMFPTAVVIGGTLIAEFWYRTEHDVAVLVLMMGATFIVFAHAAVSDFIQRARR